MAKIAEVQEVSLRLLRPYENNAKIHGKDQIEKLKKSIEEFGFLNPCLIDRDFNVIAGHGRIMAAQELGFETVPCVFVEGLTEAQRKAYILADNRLAELATWDMDIVAAELDWIRDAGIEIDVTGFELDDQVIDSEEIKELQVDADIGDAEKPLITKMGQVWQLGKHRLMVGDGTSLKDVRTLVGGSEIDLLETDPPYNVAVKNDYGMTIKNDDMKDDDFRKFLRNAFDAAYSVMKPGAVFYIWHADSNGLQFREACENAGLTIKQNLIWVKNHFTLGRQDYQWRHEPCLYGWKEGAAHYFCGKRNISTIIKSAGDIEEATHEQLIEWARRLLDSSTVMLEDRPEVDDLHPTMKPIKLIMKQIKNSSMEGQNVLDLFGGSGTTLLACEELNRNCFMMEFDPKYADVIIQRWEEQTGKKAVLVDE